jgi:hypothetical protein
MGKRNQFQLFDTNHKSKGQQTLTSPKQNAPFKFKQMESLYRMSQDVGNKFLEGDQEEALFQIQICCSHHQLN